MKLIYVASFLVFITGCGVHAPVEFEPLVIPSEFKESSPPYNATLQKNWWVNFEDEDLNNLMARALNNNIDYQITQKNIKLAKDYIKKNWFIEVIEFNQNSAEIQVTIAAAKSRMAKLELIYEVVNTYFKIAALNANIDNLVKQQQVMHELLEITQAQYDVGYIDIATQREATIRQDTIKDDIQELSKQKNTYMNYLAYLVGEYPENFRVKINPMQTKIDFQKLVPYSDPTQVVENRPDIQIARLQAESYENDQEQYEQAMLHYKSTVHHAFQEVDNILLAFKNDQASFISEKNIVYKVTENYQLAKIQYQAEQIDYNTYLNTKLHKLQAEFDLQQKDWVVYTDIIQIYKAIGWE